MPRLVVIREIKNRQGEAVGIGSLVHMFKETELRMVKGGVARELTIQENRRVLKMQRDHAKRYSVNQNDEEDGSKGEHQKIGGKYGPNQRYRRVRQRFEGQTGSRQVP